MTTQPTISIIIPVGKEGEDLYNRILKFKREMDQTAKQHNITYELILVTDLHHKPTLKAMTKLARQNIAKCLLLTRRIGKGGSIKNAVRYAKGKAIVLLDADIPVPTKTIALAAKYLLTKNLDLITANRIHRTHGTLRRILSIGYNTLVNILFKTGLQDHQAGFKILSKRAAKVILAERTRTNGLAYDTEIIVWTKKHKLKHNTINTTWKEQRKHTTIPLLRAALTILADLITLRLLTLTRKYTALQKTPIGKVIDLKNNKTIGQEYTTTIKTTGPKKHILNTLRKLYTTIAHKGKTGIYETTPRHSKKNT